MSFPSSPDRAAGASPPARAAGESSSPRSSSLPPVGALAIQLDPVGGIAGDMFVAAMVDALPWLRAPVEAALAAIKPASAPPAAFRETANGGLRALSFGLASSPAADAATHVHGNADAHRIHGSGDAEPHRRHAHGSTYAAIRDELAHAPLDAAVRRHALALLDLLADAEARVHGIARESVHFHELADWDSRMDVVAAGAIAAALEVAQWTASAPPRGGGTIRTAHGVLPVPGPATARLLEGYPWRDDGIGGERVTPTGAAILRHLVPADACDAASASGRLLAQGFGAGTRTLPGVPNVLRVLVFERSEVVDDERVALVEFDVDDMTGEELALAADRLRAVEGAIDVSVGTRAGKKGRIVADFRVLARVGAANAVADACFAETSTLGLRLREERRRVLSRREIDVDAGGTSLRVKVATRPDGTTTAKAAHDDVAATPGLAARRRARAGAEERAIANAEMPTTGAKSTKGAA
jgi:hypothetical protein